MFLHNDKTHVQMLDQTYQLLYSKGHIHIASNHSIVTPEKKIIE